MPPADDAINCPVCTSTTREYCTKQRAGKSWLIRQCSACGHGFVANRPTLEELSEYYGGMQSSQPRIRPTTVALERRSDCRAIAQRVAALTNERGRTLDIGAGGGGFSYHLAQQGFGPVVLNDMDPQSEAVTSLIPRSEFRAGAFEDIDDPGPFSAIIMSQVLEHALDPLDWLRRSRALLSERGVLAIAVPNFRGLYHIFGTRDPFLIPPSHLNYFTPKSLGLALEQCGLEPMKMESRSEMTVGTGRENSAVSMKRRVIGRAWNTVSWMLNPTRFGIILCAFARPRSPA